MKALAELFVQEGGSGLDEFGPARAEDRAVAGVGNNPEAGVRNGFEHFDGEFDGIERVAIALNDKRASLNGGKKRRREVQVVVAGGKGLGAGEDGFDLCIAARIVAITDLSSPKNESEAFGLTK